MTLASFLVTFNIEKAIGEDGMPITPTEEYTSIAVSYVRFHSSYATNLMHSVSHPKPFKCKISPRSADIETLLHRVVDAENG